MYIVSVIPLAKGVPKGVLSYHTKEAVPKGSFVSVPLRSKKILGVVLESVPAADLKAEIKNLPYAIRPVESLEAVASLSPEYIECLTSLSTYYVESLGSILYTLLPQHMLDMIIADSVHIGNTPHFFESYAFQANTGERFTRYKSFIREEFAKGRSVLFILPTTEYVEHFGTILAKGIESYIHVFHGQVSKKEFALRWQKVRERSHPVCIVASPSHLLFPRDDIGTIVVEKENSRGYTTVSSPYIDWRFVAEAVGKATKRRVIFADSLLRVSTLWRQKEGLIGDFAPVSFRGNEEHDARLSCIDMTVERDGPGEFRLLSEPVLGMLEKTREKNSRTIIFCARKGLYPSTICSDCGTLVVCSNCNAPVVLYTKTEHGEKRHLYVCHHCGQRREADILCEKCGGWRLTPFGIGIDRVEAEIKKLFPTLQLFCIDSEHISTHKAAQKVRDEFYATAGSVLLMTEMGLPYIHAKVPYSAIASLDSFFSIPDYTMNEKIFTIILTMQEYTEDVCYLQTRKPKEKIFDYAFRSSLIDFYRYEIGERKSFDFPPFKTYIKLSLSGKKPEVIATMKDVEKQLEAYTPTLFESWRKGSKELYTIHCILVLPSSQWPDTRLHSLLSSLPREIDKRIDPDTLL